ncbi:MAG: formyltransferase family protein [Chloroflexota bacterium]
MISISPYQLGWFSTGRDEAARNLLTAVNDSIRQGKIKAQIAFVFCSREPGEAKESDLFIKLVNEYRIPLVCFSYQKFKAKQTVTDASHQSSLPSWRLEYDRQVMERLKNFHPDLCVLAGYMLITGPELCLRYDMINLHPAAPGGPAGTWQEVIWQLIDKKARESGVMMHLVTPELDKGPSVTYCTYSIRGEPFDDYWGKIEKLPADDPEREAARNALFRLIRQHGLAREFPLIIATVKAFGEGKVKITADKKVVDAAGKVIIGYNLTKEIETDLKEQAVSN